MKRQIARRGSLALCVVCIVLCEQGARAQGAAPPPAAAASDPGKMDEARRHFQRGLTLLRDPEGEIVEAAYLEFKTAYELSRSPRVLGNIGYCAMKMERNSESVAAYREYVRLVPDIDPTERAQINQDLVTMTDGAATITVRYTGAAAWTLIDERIPGRAAMVTNSYSGPASGPLTLLIRPGHHVLRVKSDGEEQGAWETDATGGASLAHTFEPKPAALPVAAAPRPEAERPRPSSRAPQLITIGAGGVLLAAGAVTGIAAFVKTKNLERECPGNVCRDASFRGDVTTARSLGTATDTLLAGGGVLVVGGALWLALSSSRREREPSPSVTGACVPGACGVLVRGSF